MQVILKAKESIIVDIETNAPASRKCSCGTRYQDSTMLQAESILLAKNLGNESYSRLQSFKQRHNIVQLTLVQMDGSLLTASVIT